MQSVKENKKSNNLQSCYNKLTVSWPNTIYRIIYNNVFICVLLKKAKEKRRNQLYKYGKTRVGVTLLYYSLKEFDDKLLPKKRQLLQVMIQLSRRRQLAQVHKFVNNEKTIPSVC